MSHFHISLPAWWVKLFEDACCSDSLAASQAEVHEHIFRQGLTCLPSLAHQDLCVLASLLDQIRMRDDFASGSIRVDLRAGERVRSASRRASAGRFRELPLMLSQLKLVCADPQTNAIDAMSFLGTERWVRDETGCYIEYGLQDQSWELFSGYLDPYADARRLATGQASLKSLIRTAPLLAWHSAWLDLAEFDLLVYLRMQKALQWDLNCLNLSGGGYAPVSQLLDGVPEHAVKRRVQGPALDKCFALLQRLLRQLCEHGAARPLPEMDGYPFDPVQGELPGGAVAWQSAEPAVLEADMAGFMRRPARLFVGRFVSSFADTMRLLLPQSSAQLLTSLGMQAQALTGHLTPDDFGAFVSRHPDPHLYPVLAVFLEWSLRCQGPEAQRLPEAIRDSILYPLLEPSSQAPLGERYAKFLKLIRAHAYYGDFICQDRQATVCGQFPPLRPRRHELRSDEPRILRQSPAEPLPSAASSLSPGDEALRQVAGMEEWEAGTESQRLHGFSRAAKSRLEKIAAGELDRLAKSSPGRYQQLVGRFLVSMDAPSRTILEELRGSLNQAVFDQHIRKRLVQYLVDKPSEWSRQESPPAQAHPFTARG